MLLKFKILNLLLISLCIFINLAKASNNQPIISVYIVNNDVKHEYNKIVKNIILNELNKKEFLTEDLNLFFKPKSNDVDYIISKINSHKNNNSDIIVFINPSVLYINNNQLFVSLKAEIYNLKLKKFITSWSSPSREIIYRKNCDEICKNLEMSNNLILMSNQLGQSISNILSLNYKKNDNKTFVKKYNLLISGFSNEETLSLTDIMINEFPGFIKLINNEQYGTQFKYVYYSSADNIKIKKWLIIALRQLNLVEGKNTEVTLNSDVIMINKYPNNLSSGSKGNPKKFN